MEKILHYLPLLVAPIVLFIFTLASAYVLKFRIPNSGLGFDYIVFTLIILAGLVLGGAI